MMVVGHQIINYVTLKPLSLEKFTLHFFNLKYGDWILFIPLSF